MTRRLGVLLTRTPLLCCLLLAGCESDRAGVSDELTIVVRGDRSALEEKEKELQLREQELGAARQQNDQRIDALLKNRSDADAEQLSSARALQKELSLKLGTLQAQRTEVDARKSAIDPPLSQAAGVALSAREAAVALREAKAAEREEQHAAEAARRERELTAREKQVAAREQELAAREKELAQGGAPLGGGPANGRGAALRDVPRAQAIEQRHKKLLEELEARGILIADLPQADQPLNAEVWGARRLGDLSRASDLLAELQKAVRAVKVDLKFVEAKMTRLQGRRAEVTVSEAQKREFERLLREVTGDYTDGRYEQANKGLNKIAHILDESGSPG
jgi:hypothetical protein